MSQASENDPGNQESHGKTQSRRRALARLRDWPFIPPTLLDTPDPQLIESLGLAALNRALNLRSRRVVAFLGAGVSMSYGRIGWQDLNYSMQREVMARYELLNKPKVAGRNGGHLRDHGKENIGDVEGGPGVIESDNNASHIVTLYKTLKRLEISRRQPIPQDRLPTIFQICDRLDEALTEWEKRQTTRPDGSPPKGDEEHSEFRQRVIGMTMGDFGHAKQIILDAMRDVGTITDESVLSTTRAQRECFDENDKAHKFRGLFTCTSASVLFQELQAHANAELRSLAGPKTCTAWDLVEPLMGAIQGYLGSQGGREEHRYLLPTHRFLVGVLLRLLPRDQRRKVMEADGVPDGKAFWNQKPSAPAPMRHDIVPRSRDPLAILHQDFEISRFLTTNYDDEIERMLRDQGFSVMATSDGETRLHDRVDPLQPTAREIVFFNTSVGELVAFAVQEGSGSAGVVHLHGKAEKNGKIVATEADYQKRYMRRDEMRPLIDEAIGLAFAANPILFVGSGMGEDDILRPLRHFMSAPARQGNRLAIALLPALDAWPNVEQQQLMLLQRYGIHAVYYGWAYVSPDRKADSGTTKRLPHEPVEQTHVMWLPRVSAIKRTIEQLLNAVDDPNKFFELFTAKDKMNAYCQRLRAARHEMDGQLAALGRASPGRDNEEDDGAAEKISLVRQEDASSRRFEPHEENPTGSKLLLIAPSHIEGIELGSDAMRASSETGPMREVGLDLEVGIINAAICFVRRLECVLSSQNSRWKKIDNPQNDPYWRAVRRAIKAHHAALAGAGDGIISAFLCARLRRARRECEAWNDAWFKIPRPRDFDLPALAVSPEAERLYKVYVERHALQLGSMMRAPAPLSKPALGGHAHQWTRPQPRFYADAPSKAFHAWLSGLARNKAAIQRVIRRRVFLVAARRGVGKGHFFACLQNQAPNRNLSRLLDVISARGQRWFGVAFFNLSFSHEVGSVLDRIAYFLYDFLKASTAQHERYERDWRQVEQDRLGQLDFVLRELRSAAVSRQHEPGMDQPPPQRVFIALNCASMMFDAEGRAKNDQVGRWFEILLDARKSGALPIDLLFVCTEDVIPHYFRKDAPKHLAIGLLPASRADISEKGRRATEQRSVRLRLNLQNERASWEVDDAAGPAFGVVHFLHTARVSLLAVAFFPEVALVGARAILGRSRSNQGTAVTPHSYCNLYEERHLDRDRCNVIELFRELWEVLAPSQDPQKLDEPDPSRASLSVDLLASLLTLAAGRRLQEGKEGTSAMLGERFAKVKSAVLDALVEESQKSPRCQSDLDTRLACAVFDVDKGQAESLIADARLVDADMRETYEVLGRGRFTFTLLFATVAELIRPASLRGGEASINAQEFDEAAARGWKFFNEVRRDAKAVAEPQRADFVIGKVLNRLKEQHTTKTPLPIGLPSGNLVRREGKELFELQDALLWHLAVIGQPVEVDVLARCTLMRRAADVVMSDPNGLDGDKSRNMTAYEELLEWTLDLMVHRCLVHRLKPVALSLKHGAREIKGKDRFALHRLMQRHILQRLGTPFVEYPEADDLAPTLYASQPKNLPRLSISDHAELRETVVALSGYPDSTGRGQLFRRDTTDAERLFGPETARVLSKQDERLCRDLQLDLQKRMLRAALGIVRSVYSVPALIRFDVTSESVWRGHGREEVRLQNSLLEEHRQQVRWLLSQAVDVGRDRWRKDDMDKDSTKWTHSPFYREEIVALFNEYDLLGLIQGQVSDASEPFERSIKAARYVEPDESGPLHTRILLNAVVCDIERGRLISARATLKRIIAAEEGPDPDKQQSLSYLIATGYLGLVAHLSGDSPHAHELYECAFDGLRHAHQSRAASIFARHWADLLRSEHSEESHRRAATLVEIALSLARDCGHEDIRHMALLSQAKLKLLREDMRDYAEIHLNLNAIDRYGRVIGMRRLECEVAQVRATLHVRSGDLITAASLATRSLEIATQCELIVRKIKLLRLLASINVKQGQFAVAVPMLEEAMSMARACGWNLGLERAQNLMNEAMGARLRA